MSDQDLVPDDLFNPEDWAISIAGIETTIGSVNQLTKINQWAKDPLSRLCNSGYIFIKHSPEESTHLNGYVLIFYPKLTTDASSQSEFLSQIEMSQAEGILFAVENLCKFQRLMTAEEVNVFSFAVIVLFLSSAITLDLD